jgi:outer membrane protein assembly factor BamD
MFRKAALILFLTATACSSMNPIDTGTAEGAYKLGEKFQKDERFEDAIAQFNQVKNKHPYSKLATEAELRIADIHFDREDFIEAQNGYQAFKELHPSYPRIDYVTYRLGLSFFEQLPSTIDRDLQLAQKAILYFDEVANSHSSSEFAGPAKEHKQKALHMMAEKENYIAHFYFIRSFYLSALGRYEDLLKGYPDQGYDASSLYGAAVSAYETKELAKAKEYYDQLLSEHPNSSETSKARARLGSKL